MTASSRPGRAERRAVAAMMDEALEREVLRGLSAPRKTLPPKLFYDDRGARLFEQICKQPEYYPTNTEVEILRAHAGDIASLAGPRTAVIEYGSGAGLKTRLLLDAVRPVSYTPIEISKNQLDGVTRRLRQAYPNVAMYPLCADYTRPFTLPALPPHERKVAFFHGSTLGNFHPDQAVAFLRGVRAVVGDDGAMVLGADRRKDKAVLEAAYNDAAGVTAEFNLNMLRRLNREMAADFDVDRFRHVAFFNDAQGRIEMHLESLEDQAVSVAGETIRFRKGETIWTESSYKYDEAGLASIVEAAGFRVKQSFTDAAQRFWVVFLEARREVAA